MNPQQGNPPAAQSPGRPMAQPPAGSSANPAQEDLLYAGLMQHSASTGGYVKWFLACVAGGGAAWGLLQIRFFADLGLPLWALSLVGVPGMFWVFLRHITTRLKITRRRVETEYGVLSKQVDSLELWRVLDVRYHQSLIDRVLGNAKITLIGTDRSDPELVLYGVPNHRRMFEALRDAVQDARHTSRPMELVGEEGLVEHAEALHP